MKRSLTTGFVVLVSVLAGLASAPAASAARSHVTVRHWIGTWRGKASQKPAAPPGDPKNPYKVVVTIRTVSKRTIGTVRYPAWKCSYTLVKKSASAGKLSFVMTVVHPGPFDCVSTETVVMRATAKGASYKGTFQGGTESGSVTKAS
jgi:hypothetical protein